MNFGYHHVIIGSKKMINNPQNVFDHWVLIDESKCEVNPSRGERVWQPPWSEENRHKLWYLARNSTTRTSAIMVWGAISPNVYEKLSGCPEILLVSLKWIRCASIYSQCGVGPFLATRQRPFSSLTGVSGLPRRRRNFDHIRSARQVDWYQYYRERVGGGQRSFTKVFYWHFGWIMDNRRKRVLWAILWLHRDTFSVTTPTPESCFEESWTSEKTLTKLWKTPSSL